MRILNIFQICLIAFLLSACGTKTGRGDADAAILTRNPGKSRIRVVTTTGMIADAVKNVGGDRVQVMALMGPGIDPHLYKASEGDVSRMAAANIIFYNGLHLEGKMAEVFARMQQRVITVAVTRRIPRNELLTPPLFEGNYDPHVWFDVRLWMQAVEHIRDILMEMDPPYAEHYNRNANKFLSQLSHLDTYVREKASTVPEDKRILITAHDAFNYFGRAYGFEVKGLQGVSTTTETGTADVQKLAQIIVQREIPAIFIETSVPPRYIEALRAAVKSRGFDVKIGGYLYSDAMGNPDTSEGTYIGMVRHNIDTIVASLLPANLTAGSQ